MSTTTDTLKPDPDGALVTDASAEPKAAKRARTNRQNPILPAPVHGGYEPVHPSLDSPRHLAIKPQSQDSESLIDPHLRDLRAPRPPPVAPTANMMQHTVAPQSPAPMVIAGPPPVSIAPPVAPTFPPPPTDDGGTDGRRNKRELSQSKRAAQNRAAQRAFRQRKDAYIKQLEMEVLESKPLKDQLKSIQGEYYALRDYIILLHNRMMDAGVEVPQPPPSVSMGMGQSMAHVQESAPPTAMSEAPSSASVASTAPLDAVAQAVADLAEQHLIENQHYASQVADPSEEVHKLLGTDGLPRQP